MLLSHSEQPPPEFTPGVLWDRDLTELQSLTKTDSGITVSYSLALLKTPWPSQSFSFSSELSQLFRCPGNFEPSTILGPCKKILPKPYIGLTEILRAVNNVALAGC
jgi:hypothetical protein